MKNNRAVHDESAPCPFALVPDKLQEQQDRIQTSNSGNAPLPVYQSLEEISQCIRKCTRCSLCKTRNQTVPGEGNAQMPDILFIGEGPGRQEDRQGRPFVGPAGQLLDKMIKAMGYQRKEVFIANIVKCRAHDPVSGKDRAPLPEETAACLPWLKAQIQLIQPNVMVSLGKPAIETLTGQQLSINRERGTWRTYEGIDLLPTFHPSYLLRSPSKKKEAWLDLKAVLAHLGKAVPSKK